MERVLVPTKRPDAGSTTREQDAGKFKIESNGFGNGCGKIRIVAEALLSRAKAWQ